MNVLLIHPRIARSRLAFRHALAVVRQRIVVPPLTLLTAAAHLPPTWGKRLVDLNVDRLTDDDLRWADCAVVRAGEWQRASAWTAIRRCRRTGVRTIAFGHAFRRRHARWGLVDDRGADLLDGSLPARCAGSPPIAGPAARSTADRVDPLWELVDLSYYRTVVVPVSEGETLAAAAPHADERSHPADDVVSERWWVRQLDRLHALGWRGPICLRREPTAPPNRPWSAKVLGLLARWRCGRENVRFAAELTLDDFASDDRVRRLARAGIRDGFLRVDVSDAPSGPPETSLAGRLTEAIKRAQRCGLQIRGGFLARCATGASGALRRAVARVGSKRIEQALVCFLHAPLGARHVWPALGSLFQAGISPRRAVRILRRALGALGAVARRPRALPLALTLAVYAEHYEGVRAIDAPV